MPHSCSRSRWQQGHHNANQGEGRPLSAKWKMHRSQYERSSEFLHVRHRSVVLRGARYRRQAGCRQCSPWDEQARVSNVSTVGDGPHQFRTGNDHSTVQRTQSNSNKNAEKTTELIDFRSLITSGSWFESRQAHQPSLAKRGRLLRRSPAGKGGLSARAMARQTIPLRARRFTGLPSVPGRNGNFDRGSDRAALTSNGPGHLFDQASNDSTSKP
jgi:hypothetical protein